MIDPKVLDIFVDEFFAKNYDYLSNTIDPTFPDGMDIELFKFKIINEKINKRINSLEKEHVTTGFHNSKKYKIYNYQLKHDFSKYRLTVDTKTDFNLIKKLFKEFDYNFQVSLRSIIKYFINNRKFAKQFISLERNQGKTMNLGQKFWKRANNVIPGGSMLFSRIQIYIYLIYGLFITRKLRDAKFGI